MAASKSVSHEVHTKIDWRYALMVYRNGFKGKHGDNLLKLSKKEKKDSPINPVSSLTRRNRDFPNPAPSITRHNRDDNPGPKGKESQWRVGRKIPATYIFKEMGS